MALPCSSQVRFWKRTRKLCGKQWSRSGGRRSFVCPDFVHGPHCTWIAWGITIFQVAIMFEWRSAWRAKKESLMCGVQWWISLRKAKANNAQTYPNLALAMKFETWKVTLLPCHDRILVHCHFRPISKPKTFFFVVPKAVTFWLWTLQIEVGSELSKWLELAWKASNFIGRCEVFWCFLNWFFNGSEWFNRISESDFLQVWCQTKPLPCRCWLWTDSQCVHTNSPTLPKIADYDMLI